MAKKKESLSIIDKAIARRNAIAFKSKYLEEGLSGGLAFCYANAYNHAFYSNDDLKKSYFYERLADYLEYDIISQFMKMFHYETGSDGYYKKKAGSVFEYREELINILTNISKRRKFEERMNKLMEDTRTNTIEEPIDNPMYQMADYTLRYLIEDTNKEIISAEVTIEQADGSKKKHKVSGLQHNGLFEEISKLVYESRGKVVSIKNFSYDDGYDDYLKKTNYYND